MRGPRGGHALSAVVVMLATTGVFALSGQPAAQAGENVFVEVNPSTAQAGSRVGIRASCDATNDRQAEVTSDAFGRVVVRPTNGRLGNGPDDNARRADSGFLTGAVTVPGDTRPGDYPVDLRCPNGNTASTVLTVLNMTQPTKGPATGGGGTADDRGISTALLVGGLVAAAAAAGAGVIGNRRRGAGTGS